MNSLMFEANDQDFATQVLASELPVLIEFTADWCPPCKMLAPIIDGLATQYDGKMRVGMLDSDMNQETVQRYGVMGLPTLILFTNGQEAARIIGFTSRERIVARLAPHLVTEKA